jgi:hypothetical protein
MEKEKEKRSPAFFRSLKYGEKVNWMKKTFDSYKKRKTGHFAQFKALGIEKKGSKMLKRHAKR